MEVPASHGVLVGRVKALRDVRDKNLRLGRRQHLSCESDNGLLDAGGDRLIEQLHVADIEAREASWLRAIISRCGDPVDDDAAGRVRHRADRLRDVRAGAIIEGLGSGLILQRLRLVLRRIDEPRDGVYRIQAVVEGAWIKLS